MSPKPDTHATTATATPLPADTHATAAAAVALPAAADHGLRIGSASDPYTAILELAEYELQLARDGRIEDLRLLAPQWDALTADLPEQPPISARGALERDGAARAHERHPAVPARGADVRPAHHRARQPRRPRLRRPGSAACPPHGPQRVSTKGPRPAADDRSDRALPGGGSQG